MKLPKINLFSINLIKLYFIYVASLSLVGLCIWSLLEIALPETAENMQNVLFSTLGLKLPNSLLVDRSDVYFLMITALIVIMSIVLILVDTFFKAVVTAKLIRPKIDIATSTRGVLSKEWDQSKLYMLVRMVNFNDNALVDVQVKAVVTVTEILENDDGSEGVFTCYFPVTDIDPASVLILHSRMPWSIAVPADIVLNNSINHEYHLDVGKKIQHGVLEGRKVKKTKRCMEILIKGIEPNSDSAFAVHHWVDLDEQVGDKYKLLLHAGVFKDLPTYVTDRGDIEKYE